jgi:hypothetical protein
MTGKWKEVVGYEGLYEVSSLGFVKSLHRGGRLRVLCKIPGRYVLVNLSKRGHVSSHLVHRLVAEAFYGAPRSGEQVNHKNGNKHDNRIENLEYCTPSENKKHAFGIGLCCMKGERHNNSKLTNDLVYRIRQSLKDGVSHSAIAVEIGISRSTISKINAGKAWSHLTEGVYS